MNRIIFTTVYFICLVLSAHVLTFAQRAPSQEHMPEKRKMLGVNIDRGGQVGIKVASVVPDSTADNMGMKAGDTIVEILDRRGVWRNVSLQNRIGRHLQAMEMGDELQLKILRNEEEMILKGKVGGMKNPPIRHYSDMTVLGTYIVSLPEDYETSGKKYPVCLILHGSGSVEGHGMLRWLNNEDVIFVGPRAPYPKMMEFLVNNQAGWTVAYPDAFDEDSNESKVTVVKYADWIVKCFQEVKEKYRVAGDKMYLIGHSEGGGMSNITAALYPEKVASYYSYGAYMPDAFMTDANFSAMKAHNVKVHLVHGRNDHLVDVSRPISTNQKMKNAGINVSLRLYNARHGFTEEVQEDVDNWLGEEVRSKVEKPSAEK